MFLGARNLMGMPARQVRLAGESGFTLMEVLIAVTITAVIGLGVWQVVSSVMNSRDRVDEVAQAFDGLQKTMLLLEDVEGITVASNSLWTW